MNILTLDDISVRFGERKILDQISFYVAEGEKIGLIGINGTGKSTLLKIIAGLEEPDEGKVILANNYVVRFLPQIPVFEEDDTTLSAVLRGNVSPTNESTIEADAKSMLTRMGVTEFDKKCSQLSGGQRKRLALVNALLSSCEILILDEPTNHLDSDMASWLENQLQKRKGAVIMVTHDRYFLDSVSTRIVELDKGKIYSYEANYSKYLELKLQRQQMALATEKKRENILRTELAWVRRGAQARSTKQKARLQRFEEMSSIAKIEEDGKVVLSSVSSRLGRTTIELNNICKSYDGKTVINDFTYNFLKDDRVGFVGKNGSGKSTLMKIIMDQVKPDSGSVEIGQTVKIGYYAQEIDDQMMKPSKRVIDYIRDVAEYAETVDGKISASAMLERFLFAGEDQYGLISKLSGGEKRRLYLCRVLMDSPNVLILDEPTNDLDIATLQILEDYLDNFQGICMIVSHDRYFLDRTVRRIFAIEENGKLVQYEGGYTDYLFKRPEPVEGFVAENVNATSTNQTGTVSGKNWKEGQVKKLKFTYAEQKDYENIESEIAGIEEKIEKLEEEVLKNSRDFVKLNEITKEKENLQRLLDEKMERWMYLEDLAEKIKNQ